MSSGYIPPKDSPGPDEVLDALREALADDPRLAEMPEEEVARLLVADGHLKEEPSPPLVAEALRAIETEEGNPT
jgi:hypothetical protein